MREDWVCYGTSFIPLIVIPGEQRINDAL